jgi:hypothetical protein
MVPLGGLSKTLPLKESSLPVVVAALVVPVPVPVDPASWLLIIKVCYKRRLTIWVGALDPEIEDPIEAPDASVVTP